VQNTSSADLHDDCLLITFHSQNGRIFKSLTLSPTVSIRSSRLTSVVALDLTSFPSLSAVQQFPSLYGCRREA